MMRLFLSFVLCVAGLPLWAQDINVRTGDHATFTRIVLSMRQGTDWSIERIAEGYILRVEEPIRLNTDLFFERIQRDRIAGIRQGQSQSELLIDLACDCFAEAFQWRPDQVVIDIKDPGNAVSSDAIPIPDNRKEDGWVLQDLPDPPLPTERMLEKPPIELPIVLADTENRPTRSSLVDPLGALLTQQTRVGALESAVNESLGRALSQGLLDASRAIPNSDQDLPLEDDIAELLEGLEVALTPGIIARTSVDRAARRTLAQEVADGSIVCVPDSFVDVSNWASDIPFSILVGDLRTKITGEFDKVDPVAVEMLAKAYISFGFGREAIGTLSIDGINSRSRGILQTLGEIIDDDPITIDDLHLQIGCPGHIALWGLLAHEDGPLPAQPNVSSIVVSFKLLPKPLRQHLAPRLARKLNKLGFHDFAADVLSVGDKQNTDVATAETDILLSRGETEEAASLLAELADDDARITPEALMRLIGIELNAGRAITNENLTLLRTFQFEEKNDNLRSELIATEIKVLIAMEAYEAAQSLIDSRDPALPPDVAASFRSDIFERLARDSDDAAFLAVAFDPSDGVVDTTNQNAFAKRLLELGFPERAQDLISGQAIGDDMMERRYLRAEAAMATGNYETAKAHLAGMTTRRAQQLLSGETLSKANRDLPETVIDSSARNPDDPLLEKISELLQNTTAFQADTQTPLNDGRSLVEQSAALRTDMADLLERYQID